MNKVSIALRLLAIAPSGTPFDDLGPTLQCGAEDLIIQAVASTSALRGALGGGQWDVALYYPGTSFTAQTAIKLIADLGIDLPLIVLA